MSDIVWVYTNNLWVLTKSNAMKIFYQSRHITHKCQYYKDIEWVWAHIPWNYFYEWTITLKSPKTFMCALGILKHIKYRASAKADSAHMKGNKTN